jgi:anaerobic selenocysteine-containing dehydrogenase
MYERDDFALTFQQFQATPFRQTTEAVVDAPGEARTEWDVIDELTDRIGARTPVFAVLAGMRRTLGVFGRKLNPRMIVDGMIRLSDGGDRFGMRRGGLTFDRLSAEHPHGVVVAPHIRTGVLREVVTYRHGRIRLKHDDIAGEISAMVRRDQPARFPMRMIGMREPRSENSWMHNAPLLMRGERGHRGLMHLDDAADRGIVDGDVVQVSSAHGRIALPVALTADIVRGTIAIPHGWGHRGTGGWRVANRAGGANVNQLTSSDPRDVEALAGMSWLTGVPVQVRA